MMLTPWKSPYQDFFACWQTYCYWQWRRQVNRRHPIPPQFPNDGRKRLLILSHLQRLAEVQVFPFHAYRKHIAQRWGYGVREWPLTRFLQRPHAIRGPVHAVIFQSTFNVDQAYMENLIELLKRQYPGVVIGYLDWFAPLDIRFARWLHPHIQCYVKKNVFRDRSQYQHVTYGDTNLSEYYSRRHQLVDREFDFRVDPAFFAKLVVGWNFEYDPKLAMALMRPPRWHERVLDVHARIAVKGSPWYTAMRHEAKAACVQLTGLRVACEGKVPFKQFMREMCSSKLCFSPFGYGEVCIRDFEAVICGSAMLKPDMSHVETGLPLYQPGTTYVPLQWDLSDLGKVCQAMINDPHSCMRIAQNALQLVREHLRRDAILEQFEQIFSRLKN